MLRSEFEHALDELVSYEEGMRFQSLALVLAKIRWPDLVASERKWDLGLDAHARRSLAIDGKGKGLACSLTATLGKIKSDAERALANFADLDVLIFYTPQGVTNHTAKQWSEAIHKEFGIELIVVSREDVISSLMSSKAVGISRSILGISIDIPETIEDHLQRARAASNDLVQRWLSGGRLRELPLISLNASRQGIKGQSSDTRYDLPAIRAMLLEGRRIILEGPAGTGKTTTLIQLAQSLASLGHLTFLVDFPAWVSSKSSIFDFICGMRSYLSRDLRPSELVKMCDVEHISFMLNGWNEVSERYSEDAVHMLASLERDFPAAGIIIATRTHHITPPVPGAIRLRLRELDRVQREEFLYGFIPRDAKALLEQLHASAVLDDLTRTPLILAEVAGLYRSGVAIPQSKLGVIAAVMRLIEEGAEHGAGLSKPPLMGRAASYLSSLAAKLTVDGSVDITDEAARSAISAQARKLILEGQIAAAPEPSQILNSLCEHHVLEREDYPVPSFRFQHQQFQEYYAALSILTLLSNYSQDSEEVLRREYINKPVWGEPMRMISGAIGAADVEDSGESEGGTFGTRLLKVALSIDPIFAAELSSLSGADVWKHVRGEFGHILRSWYAIDDQPHRQCALTAMLLTGSEDFSDVILPIASEKERFARLCTYSGRGQFHISSLGQDWQRSVAQWPEDERIQLAHEISSMSHSDAVEVSTQILHHDPSNRVKITVLESLVWMGANATFERLLPLVNDDGLLELVTARGGTLIDPLSDEQRQRAIRVCRNKLADTPARKDRLRIFRELLSLGDNESLPNLKRELESLPIDQHNESLPLEAVLSEIAKQDEQWISEWISIRATSGVLLTSELQRYAKYLPRKVISNILEHVISVVDDSHRTNRQVSVFAPFADKSLISRAVEKLRSLQAEIAQLPRENTKDLWRLYRQVQDLVRASDQTLVGKCLAEMVEVNAGFSSISVLIDIYGVIGPRDDRLLDVSPEVLSSIRDHLRHASAEVLALPDYSGAIKMHYAMALSSLGNKEDFDLLRRIVQQDINRVARGLDALQKGDLTSDVAQGARMRCSNWHVVALARLSPELAFDVLLQLLDEPEYQIDAGWALVRLARTSDKDPGPHWVPDFGVVWEARAGKVPAEFREDYRGRIIEKVSVLIDVGRKRARGQQANRGAQRIKDLAKILARLDGAASSAGVVEVMSLPGKWDGWTRLEGIEACIRAGAMISSAAMSAALSPVIEEALQNLTSHDSDYLLMRCLCLFPYVSDAANGISMVAAVVAESRFPRNYLDNLIVALGLSACDAAVDLLLQIASHRHWSNNLTDHWLTAMANLDLPRTHETLLSYVDPARGRSPVNVHKSYRSEEKLAGIIANLARSKSHVRERMFELFDSNLPNEQRAMLSQVVGEMGSLDALVASLKLMDDEKQPRIPHELVTSIERILVARVPYQGSGGTFTLEPEDSGNLRKALFDMVRFDRRRRLSAFSLLGLIEVWRLDYGKPAAEPRHPHIESGYPWPALKLIA